MRTRHVVVLGLMGAGKSTLGVALSRSLGVPYRDSDMDIETLTGRTGRQIALEQSVADLHELEATVLLDALCNDEPSVISAAGWVVESTRCVAAMEQHAFTVWLDASSQVLFQRMQTGPHRREVSFEEFDQLRNRREPMFASIANLRLDATGDPAELAEIAVEAFIAVAGSDEITDNFDVVRGVDGE